MRGTGTDDAFDSYVTTRYPALLRSALLLTGDRPAAEDLAQTAMTTACARLRAGREIADLDAYLHRSLVNGRISGWRRRWRGEVPTADLPEVDVPDDTRQRDDRDELARLLLRLPERQRAAVVLRYYLDLTEAETAAALGCGAGTAKSLTARGLARLRALSQAAAAQEDRR